MKTFEEMLDAVSVDWVKEGLITDPQRATILRRHPVASGGGSRFVAVVATVGGLLFAVGVSLVVKANWQAIGDWMKIGGVVALMLCAYAVGGKLKLGRGSYPKTGDTFLMIGALLFLTGIALVSQVFHLNARPASGLMLWWLGIAAVPWLTRAKGAQFVSIVALLVWLGAEMTTTGSWIEVLARGNGYVKHDPVIIQGVFVLLGLGVWLAGLALRGGRWAEFSGMHEKCGIVVMGGALYALGFARHEWHWAHHTTSGFRSDVLGAVLVGVAAAGVGGLLAWRSSWTEMKLLGVWLALALVPVVGVVAFGPLSDDGWLWSAAAWIGLFTLSIAVVRAGLETGREGWVNLGIAFIALNIVTRYFDLFGTLLEGGVFFIVTGVIVVALGIYLERKRRAFVARMREEGHS